MLLDDQATQIFATSTARGAFTQAGSDDAAFHGHIHRLSRIADDDAEFVSPAEMLCDLVNDNKAYTASLRKAHEVADKHNDAATTSILEVYIDEFERRTWFLFEASRGADRTGH